MTLHSLHSHQPSTITCCAAQFPAVRLLAVTTFPVSCDMIACNRLCVTTPPSHPSHRLACSLGHTSQVQLLLSYMVELRSADAYLRALCAASAAGHAALVTTLLAAQPLQQQLAQ